jgi:hypothetical protein
MMKHSQLSAFFLAAVSLVFIVPASVSAKRDNPTISPDDPTFQLYQLLDNSYGGNLKEFYLLADIYGDPQTPGKQFQHVLLVEYDKSRFFGRLRILVRSVAKLTPAQLKTYSPKQIYDFGEQDEQEFEKIDPGPFGQKGDLFLRATRVGPLAPAPTTDEVRMQYDSFLTKYVLPALKK